MPPKPPRRPRVAYTPYQTYSCDPDVRACVKKENPDAGTYEIFGILGDKWQKLSDEEKRPYILKAEADQERFAQEMEKYEEEMKKYEETYGVVELKSKTSKAESKECTLSEEEEVLSFFKDFMMIRDYALMLNKEEEQKITKNHLRTNLLPTLQEMKGALAIADAENNPAVRKMVESVKKENPDAGFDVIGKIIGDKWEKLSDEEKRPYLVA